MLKLCAMRITQGKNFPSSLYFPLLSVFTTLMKVS